MHNSRSRIALAILTAALARMGSAAQHAAEQVVDMVEAMRRPRGWRNPFAVVVSTNRFKPHQGARECARRIGGATWAAHEAGDRVRRGLPVEG